jgi:predicted small lipoprotein YifL
MHVQSRPSLAALWLTPTVAGLCALLLAGCGQKGPLVLPAAPAAAVAASAPAAAVAASAPAR